MPFVVEPRNQLIESILRKEVVLYEEAVRTLAAQGKRFYLILMQPEVPVYNVDGTRIFPAPGNVFVQISSETADFQPFWEEVRRIKNQSK